MDDIRYYMLVGLLIGVLLFLLIYLGHAPKKRLLVELVRTNQLHALRFTAVLWSMLEEKDLVRAYSELHSHKHPFRLRQAGDAASPEDAKEIEAGLNRLDSYLSVLEVICFAVSEGVLDSDHRLILLGERLDDLNRYPDVCRYIEEYAGFYKNLIREMNS